MLLGSFAVSVLAIQPSKELLNVATGRTDSGRSTNCIESQSEFSGPLMRESQEQPVLGVSPQTGQLTKHLDGTIGLVGMKSIDEMNERELRVLLGRLGTGTPDGDGAGKRRKETMNPNGKRVVK